MNTGVNQHNSHPNHHPNPVRLQANALFAIAIAATAYDITVDWGAFRKPLLLGEGRPEGLRSARPYQKVMAAFVASLASICENREDRAKTVIVPALDSRNTISSPSYRGWMLGVCYTFS
jgi:hypothetical protein